MNKHIVTTLLCLLAFSATCHAQLAFWNYDNDNNEMTIPIECDGVFDESRGGVYVPTSDEMFERGEEFLINPNPVERNKAGFCLIAAAMQGNIPAQFRVAQLYNKGIILPQDDLSAYRWAFLASLNGHPEASRLALLLERFLTTEEIEKATSNITQQLPQISKRYKSELAEQEELVNDKRQKLEQLNEEIDSILGIKTPKKTTPKKTKPNEGPSHEKAQKAAPKGSIFSQNDRMKKR